MLTTLAGLIAVALLIAATAVFVAAEFALVAVDRSRLEHAEEEGSRAARTTLAMHRRLSFQLSGMQLGITLCSLALGLLAAPALEFLLRPGLDLLPGELGDGALVVVALALATTLQMVLGELAPKNVAVARPLRTAIRYAPFVRWFNLLFTPFIATSNGLADRIVRLLGLEPAEEVHGIRTRSDLERVIRSSGLEGTIDADDVSLLTRTFAFSEKTAADALTPRVAVEALADGDTVADLVARTATTGLSRFPVYRRGMDDIVGIVLVKDVFGIPPEERATTPLAGLMRPTPVVPESKRLDELLVELRDEGNYLAIVLDEYGGTAGILTLEDIVEEIVGDIADEHDPEERPSVLAWGGAWLLSGRLHLNEVTDACGLELPDGDYETLAGFILDRLGRIPTVGDNAEFDGWRLQVREMDRRRIASIRVLGPTRPAEGAS